MSSIRRRQITGVTPAIYTSRVAAGGIQKSAANTASTTPETTPTVAPTIFTSKVTRIVTGENGQPSTTTEVIVFSRGATESLPSPTDTTLSPIDTTPPSNDTAPSSTTSLSIAQNTDEASGPGGLSSNAKIAIGVTIPVIVVALLVAFLFYWRWKRARTTSARTLPPSIAELEAEGNAIRELDAGNTIAKAELPADCILVPFGDEKEVELSQTPQNNELGTGYMPIPLPGSIQNQNSQMGGVQSTAAIHSHNHDTSASPARLNLPTVIDSENQPQARGDGSEEDEEMRWLRAEQERVNERRERIRRLEQLDEEESRIQQRIKEKLLQKGDQA